MGEGMFKTKKKNFQYFFVNSNWKKNEKNFFRSFFFYLTVEKKSGTQISDFSACKINSLYNLGGFPKK